MKGYGGTVGRVTKAPDARTLRQGEFRCSFRGFDAFNLILKSFRIALAYFFLLFSKLQKLLNKLHKTLPMKELENIF